MGFTKMTIEISGTCNAFCKWCTTGIKNRSRGTSKAKFMTADEFERILDYVVTNKIIEDTTEVELYNWGEPLLNPEINDIIAILESRKRKYHLSTNAYYIENFHPEKLEYLTTFRVSVSGISPENYSRIYKLPVDRILENIIALKDRMNAISGNAEKLEVSFLVYRFNLGEIFEAAKFFKNKGIRFVTRLAYFADYSQCQSWLLHKMSEEETANASEDLMLELWKDRTKNIPDDFVCPQYQVLVISEYSEIIPCCRLDRTFQCGNIFEVDADKLKNTLSIFRNSETCKACLESGQAWLCNTNNEFYSGFKYESIEQYLIRNKELKSKLENTLQSFQELKNKYIFLEQRYKKMVSDKRKYNS